MKILCNNQYSIRKVDKDGVETELARFHNVPLQAFYDAISGHVLYSTTSCIHSCWFGTGTSQPSASDTGLESPLWTYNWNNNNCSGWEKYVDENNHICHKYTFRVDADAQHVGTVSEVGITVMKSSGSLALGTHALILDAEGNPMTITKTDLDVLFVEVLFEFSLEDSNGFTWFPQNYVNYGSRSGSGWAPAFNLGLIDRIYFLGRCDEDGFGIRLATLSFSKSYASNNHEVIVSGARLPQTTITSQRFIKAIGVGNSDGAVFGIWKLPNADVIPSKLLSGMSVGVGDGTTTQFNPPLAEWVENSEAVYVNDVLQVRGVDYTCSHNANYPGLAECSILSGMRYIGETTSAPQNIRTPIVGLGSSLNGGYKTALWNSDHRTITYAFPENAIKGVKKFVFRNFIAYSSLSPRSASYNTDWSRAVWTVKYSSDGETWTDAGTATMGSDNVATLEFENSISARYWSFYISSRVTGIYFAANADDSIMAYGDEAQPITFAVAPAEGAVITMNASVDCPMKNENFVIDVNPTFSL